MDSTITSAMIKHKSENLRELKPGREQCNSYINLVMAGWIITLSVGCCKRGLSGSSASVFKVLPRNKVVVKHL